MKRAIALTLMLTVILACLPAVSLAAKQMEDGVRCGMRKRSVNMRWTTSKANP